MEEELMALVRFDGEDGSFMWVETTPVGGSSQIGLVADEDGSGSRAVARLEDALGSVRGAAVAFMATVDVLKKRSDPMALDEVCMELALSLGVEGGVIVAKGSASAEASITLTWRATDHVS
jgi:hypothetical protein